VLNDMILATKSQVVCGFGDGEMTPQLYTQVQRISARLTL